MRRYPMSTRLNWVQNDDAECAKPLEYDERRGAAVLWGAQMKKPTIRVTKWLGDIPVEAGCSACSSVVFKAVGSSHRPNREEFQRSLQVQFDTHCKEVHSQR